MVMRVRKPVSFASAALEGAPQCFPFYSAHDAKLFRVSLISNAISPSSDHEVLGAL
jgi:hypothetical protein